MKGYMTGHESVSQSGNTIYSLILTWGWGYCIIHS